MWFGHVLRFFTLYEYMYQIRGLLFFIHGSAVHISELYVTYSPPFLLNPGGQADSWEFDTNSL